jgi:hypothetical protein
MIFHATPGKDAQVTELEKRGDNRGYFGRMFCEKEFGAAGRASRLGLECGVCLPNQTDFSKPPARINTDIIDPAAHGWSEAAAWDAMAAFDQA